jgi:hypothetical protein
MHSLYSNIDFLMSECETIKLAAVQRNLAALASTTTDEDCSDAETVQMMPEVFLLLGPNLKRLHQSTLVFSTTNSPNSPPLNKKQKKKGRLYLPASSNMMNLRRPSYSSATVWY